VSPSSSHHSPDALVGLRRRRPAARLRRGLSAQPSAAPPRADEVATIPVSARGGQAIRAELGTTGRPIEALVGRPWRGWARALSNLNEFAYADEMGAAREIGSRSVMIRHRRSTQFDRRAGSARAGILWQAEAVRGGLALIDLPLATALQRRKVRGASPDRILNP